MTIAAEICYAELAWTGVETLFNPGLSALDRAHVLLRYRDANGIEVGLADGVHLALSKAGADGQAGAITATPIALPAAPGTVIFDRQTPATQSVAFQDLVKYSANVHEALHDAAALRAAEMRRATAAAVAAINASDAISFYGTSSTAVAIGGGTKNFVTQVNKDFIGRDLLITSDSDPSLQSMSGRSMSYDPLSGALAVDVENYSGSGTHSDWTIRVSGAVGQNAPGQAMVTTRALLSTLAADVKLTYLLELGRQGTFIWSASDHSVDVTNDPAQGVYVPPASDPTGTSGCWVRSDGNGMLFVSWFGADLSAIDSAAGIQAAVNFAGHRSALGLNILDGSGGAATVILDGIYKTTTPVYYGDQQKGIHLKGLSAWGCGIEFTGASGQYAIDFIPAAGKSARSKKTYDCTFSDLNIIMINDNVGGIRPFVSDWGKIEKCYFTNVGLNQVCIDMHGGGISHGGNPFGTWLWIIRHNYFNAQSARRGGGYPNIDINEMWSIIAVRSLAEIEMTVSGTTGTLVVGDTIRGNMSGATGTIFYTSGTDLFPTVDGRRAFITGETYTTGNGATGTLTIAQTVTRPYTVCNELRLENNCYYFTGICWLDLVGNVCSHHGGWEDGPVCPPIQLNSAGNWVSGVHAEGWGSLNLTIGDRYTCFLGAITGSRLHVDDGETLTLTSGTARCLYWDGATRFLCFVLTSGTVAEGDTISAANFSAVIQADTLQIPFAFHVIIGSQAINCYNSDTEPSSNPGTVSLSTTGGGDYTCVGLGMSAPGLVIPNPAFVPLPTPNPFVRIIRDYEANTYLTEDYVGMRKTSQAGKALLNRNVSGPIEAITTAAGDTTLFSFQALATNSTERIIVDISCQKAGDASVRAAFSFDAIISNISGTAIIDAVSKTVLYRTSVALDANLAITFGIIPALRAAGLTDTTIEWYGSYKYRYMT